MDDFANQILKKTVVISPLLNYLPGRDIKVAVSFDDEAPQYITNVPDKYNIEYSNANWIQSVLNQARTCKTKLNISKPGYHTLKVILISTNIFL